MDVITKNSKYDACWERWKMATDFYRGGRSVLQPDWQASFGHFISERNEPIIDGDEFKQNNAYEWTQSFWKSYLWKHPSERIEEYNERHARAYHTLILAPIIDIFSSGIFKAGQSRNHTDSIYEDFFTNVDLRGTTIDTFSRSSFEMAMCCGRTHAVVDMPRYSNPVYSYAEQQRLGIRAFAREVSPLDLIDWELDFYGKFIWVKIAESPLSERGPLDKQDLKGLMNYRIITRDYWQLFQGTSNSDAVLIDEGELPDSVKGTVPIATLWTSKFHEMDCESPLSSIVDADRHFFNKSSEIDTVERMNGFSILGVPNIEGVPLGFIEMGPGRALTYPAAAGSPVWLSSDPDILKVLNTINRERFDLIRMAAGVSRGAAEGSKELRSAAALDEENETKRNQMTKWATASETYENEILSLVSKYHGIEPTRTVYRKNFSMRAVSAQINDLLQLKATETVPGKGQVELAKPLVDRIMQEHGVDPDVIAAVLDSMKDLVQTDYSTPSSGKIKPVGFEGQGSTNPGVK